MKKICTVLAHYLHWMYGKMTEAPFQRYDAEFLSLSNQVQSSLNGIQSSKTPSSQPQNDLSMCKGLLSQCDDLLKQMSLEARSVDSPTLKSDLLKKVRVYKTRLANLRDDYKSSKTTVEREALLSSSSHDRGSGFNSDHRERLLNTNESLSSQNDTLDHARRVMAETEDVAMEITTELGRNREKIQSAHLRVRDVSGLTNQARRIVQSMSRREVQQKLAMMIMTGLIILTFTIIIYRMWF